MKIIIAGAGQTGVALAKYLRAENNDIVLIDKDRDQLGYLSEQLDIQTIEGSASFPAVLERAGAAHADAFLAVTGSDEMNIVSCGVAKSVFNIQKRIARISSVEYLSNKYRVFLDALSIDVAVSPELETAQHILETMPIAGAVEAATMGDGYAKFVGLRCKRTARLIGKTIAETDALLPGVGFKIVAVKRRSILMPPDRVIFRPGDDVYFLADTRHLVQILDTLGYESLSPRYIVIFGGSKAAFQLAKMLEKDAAPHEVTLVEEDADKARLLAEKLNRTLVMSGDVLDDAFVDDLDLKNYGLSVTATESDENNILLSLVAKRNGIPRTCALIDNPLYNTVLSGLGVDTTVNPNAIMVSSILHHLRKGRVRGDYVLQSGIGEVLEVEVLATSRLTKAPLEKTKLPAGVEIGAVIREGLFLLPTPALKVREKDIVLMFVPHGKIHKAEKLFAAGFTFF